MMKRQYLEHFSGYGCRLILHQYYNLEKYSNDFYFSMMNTASRDPFVHQADAAYDDHIKKQGQAPDYFG